LVAQIFDATSQLITSYYSESTHTFSNTGPAEFSFVNAYIPESYKFIRFILVADKSVELPTTNNSINSNCLSFRTRPIKLSDSFTFDDDDCLVYSNQNTDNINWLVGMTIDYKQRVENNSGNSGSSDNSEISDYIIESYSNETEWYRLYKSGWVEQGGKYIWDGSNTTPREIPITLYKEMDDTTYTVHTTSSNYTAAGYFPWVNNITTTGFILYASGTAGTRSDIFWRVCGRTN
jgi:oxalate decarboxylase/phosphoglucose isomerase-like protein (cupin superfamily)